MEIMSLLDRAGMNRLRADFEKRPEGLSLAEFVSLIILRLPDTGQSDLEMVAKLLDLFHQVDVNGDGTMEWEEFSEFCIEAGIAASHMSDLEVTEKYVQESYTDVISHTPQITSIKFIPQLDKVAVCESGARCLRLYSSGPEGFHFKHEIDLRNAIQDRSSAGNPGTVLACEYLEVGNRKMLAVSSSNMTISFWDAGIYDVADDSVPRFLDRLVLDKPQFFLCYAPHIECLFTAGAEPSIRVHQLRFAPNFSLKEICVLSRHTDLIQDLLAVPELNLVVSASLDHKILLWGLDEDTVPIDQRIVFKSERTGHQKGVRSLAYAENGLLLSASFDLVVLAWDITEFSVRPVFQLKGHANPLFGVRVLPSKQHAVTLDTKGIFKMWDIRREGSIMDSERGIQTFAQRGAGEQAEDDVTFSPCAFDVTAPHGTIIAAKNRLMLFKTVQLQPEKYTPAACVYNPTSMTIACAIHRDVKVWDARTGVLLCHFQGIAQADISALALDFRERKFIASDRQGNIVACNYLNGSRMKGNEHAPHDSEISCMVYGREDKVIVSSGWDKTIRVFDETQPNAIAPLRKVVGAHLNDITALSLSHELSLIASGDLGGAVRIWDFQFLTLEGEFEIGHAVVGLKFCGAQPVMISVDQRGMIQFWAVRPFTSTQEMHRNTCAAAYADLLGLSDEEMVTVMELEHPASAPSQLWGWFGTSLGRIVILDFTETLQSFDIPPVSIEQRIHRRENYSAGRKVLKIFNAEGNANSRLASRERGRTKTVPGVKSPLVQRQWHAHADGVASLQVLDDPTAILTCGGDKAIRLWRYDGKQLGSLDSNERKALAVKRVTKTWDFPIDMESRRRRELIEAQTLMDRIFRQMEKTKGTVLHSNPHMRSTLNGERRNLSHLMRQEEVHRKKQHHLEKLQLEIRRDERRQRAEHVRELNFNLKAIAEKDAKVGQAAFAVLNAVVAGETDGMTENERERKRLLGQLEGKCTWIKTQQELAREAAEAREKAKARKLVAFSKNVGKLKPKGSSKGKRKGKNKGKAKGKGMAKGNGKAKGKNEKEVHAKSQTNHFKAAANGSRGSVQAPDPVEAMETVDPHDKTHLYSNLRAELQRIESKEAKRTTDTGRRKDGKIDLQPPALVKQHLDELRFVAKINKRHAMSAPLLKLDLPPSVVAPGTRQEDGGNAHYGQGEEHYLQGLNWKYVADKVKNELQAKFEQRSVKKGNGGAEVESRSSMTPLRSQKSRLSVLSSRMSQIAPGARNSTMILLSPNQDEGEFKEAQIEKEKEKARRAKEAEHRREVARAKLDERKSTLLAKLDRERMQQLQEQKQRESQYVQTRASAIRKAIQRTLDPTKEQLKRIKLARYLGPYLKQDIAHIRDTFQGLDRDGNGTIDLREFQMEIKKTSSESGNFRSLLDQSVRMFHSIDKDNSGTIALDELARVLFKRATANEFDDILVFLKMQARGKNRRLTSLLDPEALATHQSTRKSTKPVEKPKPTRNFRAEIRALFDLYDVNRDGQLSRNEMQDAIQQNGRRHRQERHHRL
ncbi:Lissencephaly-1 homolog [Durusdinium trenchii]|uniref:Lissencephaly-1 homolog n=1 Tax=Durusdinium trenchii TaxID=1381693 RepID=A0ABP0S050_9DINO